MAKLTIIHGPGKGMSIRLEPGERTIGRSSDNDIVLASQQVSKRHCSLQVDENSISISDGGSANGTFVNGTLSKQKELKSGDRITVGDVTLEVSMRKAVADDLMQSNVIPIRGAQVDLSGFSSAMPEISSAAATPVAPAPPQTIKEKIAAGFETYVLNFLYNANQTAEWKNLVVILFGFLCVVGTFAAVYPMMDRTLNKLEFEAKERAALIARQLVDRNAPHIYNKIESSIDVSFAEHEKGVSSAVLIDLDGRIMAPARLAGQYLSDNSDAVFSALVREKTNKNESISEVSKVFGKYVYVGVPLRIFVSGAGKNVVTAIGIVKLNRDMLLFDDATIYLTYIQSMILMALLTVIAYFSVYRITLKPLETLNSDIDNVLKGSATVVEKKYKMEEINTLIDIVNVTLQRASSGGSGSNQDSVPYEDVLSSYKAIAEGFPENGFIVLSAERHLLFINEYFENITGIRLAVAAGAEFSQIARDQAFNSFIVDITSKSFAGSGAVNDSIEFSGVNYLVTCTALGASGTNKYYIISARKEG